MTVPATLHARPLRPSAFLDASSVTMKGPGDAGQVQSISQILMHPISSSEDDTMGNTERDLINDWFVAFEDSPAPDGTVASLSSISKKTNSLALHLVRLYFSFKLGLVL